VRGEGECGLPGLAFAGRMVEIGRNLPPFRRPALAAQNEAVRLEQPAQILVGKQALVLGVARALEAVDRERLQRVDGSQLVDDEHGPARPGHPSELRDDELGSMDVVERAQRPSEVERRVGEGQMCRVRLFKRHVRRRTLMRACEQLGLHVDADRLRDVRCKRERERTRTGPDVEHALVAARLHEREHLLLELRRTCVLPCRDEVGCAREAVHDSTTRRARKGSLLMPTAIS